MIARLLQVAHPSIDPRIRQRGRQLAVQQQVVDAQPRVLLPMLAEVVPERVDAFLGVELADRVHPSLVEQLPETLARRGLEERAIVFFEDVRKQQRPLAVLFADLDGFKGINDTLGHHVGDVVLKKVAGLISATIRDKDLAARYGGDEFVVIMPNTRLPQALLVAERLQAAVTQWARSGEVNLSLSIGIGEAPSHGQELGALLERVDGAMYLCKQSYGRGGIRAVEDVV